MKRGGDGGQPEEQLLRDDGVSWNKLGSVFGGCASPRSQAGGAPSEAGSQGPSIPIDRLPDLPARGGLYWSQPVTALAVVGGLSALLCVSTRGVALADELPYVQLRRWLLPLIYLWAGIAVAGTLFVVFAGASEIQRSEATCYPIPDEVEARLRTGETLHLRDNIKGPVGSRTHGTYCVRCLVWRPPSRDPVTSVQSKNHHCSICQRCVVGFDHHCDFFGRCIVDGNMTCFGATIGMLWAGLITSGIAFFIWAGAAEDDPALDADSILRPNITGQFVVYQARPLMT